MPFGSPLTILSPTEVPQRTHRYSYLSPSGRTSRRRSRTGIDLPHFGQKSSTALRFSNCFFCGSCRRTFGLALRATNFCISKLHQFFLDPVLAIESQLYMYSSSTVCHPINKRSNIGQEKKPRDKCVGPRLRGWAGSEAQVKFSRYHARSLTTGSNPARRGKAREGSQSKTSV